VLQAYMKSRLPENLHDPWCDNLEDGSEQCLEVNLFREWQTGAPEPPGSVAGLDADSSARTAPTGAASSPTPSPRSFLEPRPSDSELQWAGVAKWRTQHGADTPVIKPEALRSARWAGRPPSVACVALLPEGPHAEALAMRLVDEFTLQTYEGDHWLVLVHHENDVRGAEIVEHFANTSFIRIAVARSPKYPSAAALRYGAWLSSDADAVARWDVDAQHHPEQLSMQVRAMALSQKPASLLAGWMERKSDGEGHAVSEGEHWDGSLVGEARWMREHWWPYSVGDSYLLEPPASHKIVRVDSAELLEYPELPIHLPSA